MKEPPIIQHRFGRNRTLGVSRVSVLNPDGRIATTIYPPLTRWECGHVIEGDFDWGAKCSIDGQIICGCYCVRYCDHCQAIICRKHSRPIGENKFLCPQDFKAYKTAIQVRQIKNLIAVFVRTVISLLFPFMQEGASKNDS